MIDVKGNLREALGDAALAKSCIRYNRGYDKELARDGYAQFVEVDVFAALEQAIDSLDDPEVIMRVAKFVLKQLEAQDGSD